MDYNTPKTQSECSDILKINIDIDETDNKLKKLRKFKKQCNALNFKDEYKLSMTLRELQNIIIKENIEDVEIFLDLFVDTRDKVVGVNTTKNHVYEALWILVYLHELDNFNDNYEPGVTRQFYKSVEGGMGFSTEKVLDEKVAAGSSGGIVDIYFEIHGKVKEKLKEEYIEYKKNDIIYKYPIPWCEGNAPKVFDKYLCSVKYYGHEKSVQSYDIADICVEASNKFKDYNILLLVKDKQTLETNISKSHKELTNRFHKIYDVKDLDILYKKLLHGLKQGYFNEDIIKPILKPRFHQEYFVEYTIKSIEQKSKNFIWGAVPRSGKSFMISGLISKLKPKCVILYLGAISETRGQFIKMFEMHQDFNDYEIYDMKNAIESDAPINKGISKKTKKIIILSQEKGRQPLTIGEKKHLPKIIVDTFSEKDKLIFFDEIHQGSGEGSLQEKMLDDVVFNPMKKKKPDNPYKAFIMVTATFAKPYIKYLNKSDAGVKLLSWNYDNIQSMKEINKTDTDDFGIDTKIVLNQILSNIELEDDGKEKRGIFEKLLDNYKSRGTSLEILQKEYEIYPELIVSTPSIPENASEFMVEQSIDIERIFRPLMKKNASDIVPCEKYIQYIWDNIYEKFLVRTLGFPVTRPHTQLWFMPTILRNKDKIKDESKTIGPFSYMCKHFTELLMKHPKFREQFCIIILHSTGFDNTEVEFLEVQGEGGKIPIWDKANVEFSSKGSGCVSTICNSSNDLKQCILEQEAQAKARGKSLIIMTGKMLRLGISLPCVDIALHMDPITSVDTIYQSMFRVLTERKGKDRGIFIDMLTKRQISFMYQYMNYTTPIKSLVTIEKRQKRLLEKLIIYNFNGINNTEGKEYQDIYNKLMNDFNLNDKQKFVDKQNEYEITEANELLENPEYDKLVDGLYKVLQGFGIKYGDKKAAIKKELYKKDDIKPGDEYVLESPKDPPKDPPKDQPKDPPKDQPKDVDNVDLKFKRQEIVSFMKDFITLFILFNTNETILPNMIEKDFHNFFKNNTLNIEKKCSEKINGLDTLNCHLLYVLRSKNSDPKILNENFKIFKSHIREFFMELIKSDEFMNMYNSNMNDIQLIKDNVQELKQIKPCSDDFIKNRGVLEIIRNRLTIRKEEKNLYGEVFTPVELICEMFDKIPDEVWKNPDLKWLDPANGIGNFPVVAYYKLMESLKDNYDSSKYSDKSLSKHIIEDMLYMVELNPVNSNVCEKIFKMIDPKSKPNIITKSFLDFSPSDFEGKDIEGKDIDKFNVIIGNPPFQKSQIGVRKGKGQNIWDKFVIKSFEIMKDNSIFAFIHPPNWRGPDNKLWDILSQKQLLYLHIFNKKDGIKIFNASTRFDVYVLENKPVYKNTDIIDELGNINSINLSEWSFLPNYDYDNIKEILTTEENGIDVIYNTYYHNQNFNKGYLSDKKTNVYKIPIVHSVNKEGLGYWYSSFKKKEHFIPKVILNVNEKQYNYKEQNDYNGLMGMSNNSFGIPITSKKEGDLILKAIGTDKFKTMINATKWGSFQTDYKMFKYFKKDFYKYFIDDGEVNKYEDKTISIPNDFFKLNQHSSITNKSESKTKKKNQKKPKCSKGSRRDKKTGLCIDKYGNIVNQKNQDSDYEFF